MTIYTSNLKIDDLKIDDRIKDRIEATSYIVNLPETPVRKNKSEADKNKLMDDLMNKNAPNGVAAPSQGDVTKLTERIVLSGQTDGAGTPSQGK